MYDKCFHSLRDQRNVFLPCAFGSSSCVSSTRVPDVRCQASDRKQIATRFHCGTGSFVTWNCRQKRHRCAWNTASEVSIMYKQPLLFFLSVCVAFLISRAISFTVTQRTFVLSRSPFLLFGSIANKYFQLEEAEDKDTCTTELFLKEDKTVTVGESDGPLPLRASGSWDQRGDGSFTMTITRTFEAGKEKTMPTDIGEFTFTVERLFSGDISAVGGRLAMSGSMHDIDELLGDRRVGFFNMIDTTKERLKNKEN